MAFRVLVGAEQGFVLLLTNKLTGRSRFEEASLLGFLLLVSPVLFGVLPLAIDILSLEELSSNMLLGREREDFLRNLTPLEATPLDSPTILSAEFSAFNPLVSEEITSWFLGSTGSVGGGASTVGGSTVSLLR